MKIGINARTFSVDQPGGAVKVGQKIHEYLVQNECHSVVSFGPPQLELDSQTDSWLYPSNSQLLGLLWERLVLPSRARSHNLDVLFCPNANGFFHDSTVPTAVMIHDMNSFNKFSGSLYSLYERTILPIVANKATKIITVSNFSKNEIVSHLGINSSKVSVVYNGIDEFLLNNEPGKEIHLPEKYVLFVGALNPRKNINGVLSAFKEFSRSNPDYKLVIVGPKNKAVFQDYAIEATERVHLPGFVSQRELKYTYQNADVFLFPSYYEGFGLPPLEAMACGTPVVAANTSSLPEILGDAAMFADPDDHGTLARHMEQIVTNRDLREKLIKNGLDRAQEFTWDKSVHGLTEILTELHIEHNS